jgi:hypothetical protein
MARGLNFIRAPCAGFMTGLHHLAPDPTFEGGAPRGRSARLQHNRHHAAVQRRMPFCRIAGQNTQLAFAAVSLCNRAVLRL